jgi:DNA ligase D
MEFEFAVDGVRLSHPDKVLYPEQNVTKRVLAEYYESVAGVMLPHVVNRAISLLRCPSGRQSKCFFQRHANAGSPAELKEVRIEGFGDSEPFLYITNAKGLIALVQMGVLEIHPWGSRVDRPLRPDRIVFDLDPGEDVPFEDVIAAARDTRNRLLALGLKSFVKTTGGKGLHVVVPIARRPGWPDVKAFARSVADQLARDEPGRFLARVSKAERAGRIFVDYLRNDPTSTAVAPYSTRAREGATVATPLAWDELTPRLDPSTFNVLTVPKRLARLGGDPWADMLSLAQRLPSNAK